MKWKTKQMEEISPLEITMLDGLADVGIKNNIPIVTANATKDDHIISMTSVYEHKKGRWIGCLLREDGTVLWVKGKPS